MRLLVLFALLFVSSVAAAQETIVITPRRVVISAQEHAEIIARRGRLSHSSCSQTEGIGVGATPDQARRNCCYFGRRVIVEEGVAYSPIAGRWFAVIRYR